MRNGSVKMRALGAVATAFAVLGLAACGSSSSTAQTSNSSAPPGATPTTGASPAATSGTAAVVKAASNAKLGTVLVDSSGMTLYTLTNAGGTPVQCTGQCLTFWPPLLLASGATTASAAPGVTGLGTTTAAGGTQVTDNGDPLYHFSGDKAAGDANGEGISSFGGTWHVVKSSAAADSAPPATTPQPTSAPTTSGGGGYYP